MKRPPLSARRHLQLSSTLHKNLNTYALSAVAAGVGALMAVPPAAAEIVYTPAHQAIPPNRSGSGFPLDLNHDGVNDFFIVNFYSSTSNLVNVWISPAQAGNEIFSEASGYAAAIPAGVAIGANGRFHPAETQDLANNDFPVGICQGPWKAARNKFLGLKFEIDGAVHFGWARLSVTCFTPRAAKILLTGYAYETVAGEAIRTGDMGGTAEQDSSSGPQDSPSSTFLGTLALGYQGLAAWRLREPSAN